MTFKRATAIVLLMFAAATCIGLVIKAIAQTKRVAQTKAATISVRNGVKVYYFHSNTRCQTCRTIEAYAREAVQSGFSKELGDGSVLWEVVNYEAPGNDHFATDYEIVAPMVVFVKFADGKQVDWKSVPEVWQNTDDKAAFLSLVQNSLREFLTRSTSKPTSES